MFGIKHGQILFSSFILYAQKFFLPIFSAYIETLTEKI